MNVNATNNLAMPNVLNSLSGLQTNNINSNGFLQMFVDLMSNLDGSMVQTENSFNFQEVSEMQNNMNFQIPLDKNLINSLSYLNPMDIDTKPDDILNDNNPTISTDIERDDKELLENYKIISQANIMNPYIVYNDNFVPADNISYEYVIPKQVFSEYKGFDNIQMKNNLAGKESYIKPFINETKETLNPLIKETYSSVHAEKLANLINSHKSALKNEIDFNKAMLVTNKIPITDNKVITVIDESQEVRPQVLNQVRDKIEFMIDDVQKGGAKHVTMELHPLKLGKVEIKMTYENDKLSVEINSENEETQKILSSNINELTKILSKSTEAEVNVIVKPNVTHYEFKTLYTDNQNEGQGRQKNHYYEQQNDNKTEDNEEIDFSELINLRNLKLSKV